jgi:hypothetical protein
MKRYIFTIAIQGYGDNEDQAWADAIDAFTVEPGPTPDDADYIDEIDDGDDCVKEALEI